MGADQPLLSIVVPVFNEERRLLQTLESLGAFQDSREYATELIVVDDGSDDGTANLVESFTADRPTARLIRNPHRGKGYTVRTGMLAAQGRYVLFTDADLATPIDEAEKLIAFLDEGFDVAIGSREGLGAQRHGEPWFRHFIGRVFNLLVRAIAVGNFQDTQCGFKAFQQRAAQDIFSSMRLYGEDAPEITGAAVTAFDVEVLYLALKKGYRVKDIPVEWHYGEHSKVNPIKDSWRNFTDVVNVRLNALRGLYD
jgi:glycosyltransferase involved in cell wall biosynthesis